MEPGFGLVEISMVTVQERENVFPLKGNNETHCISHFKIELSSCHHFAQIFLRALLLSLYMVISITCLLAGSLITQYR